jgi:hypothetical protein
LHSTALNLHHHPSNDIDIENHMEDSDLHKEASQGDLSEDESNERYDLQCDYFRFLALLQQRFFFYFEYYCF